MENGLSPFSSAWQSQILFSPLLLTQPPWGATHSSFLPCAAWQWVTDGQSAPKQPRTVPSTSVLFCCIAFMQCCLSILNHLLELFLALSPSQALSPIPYKYLTGSAKAHSSLLCTHFALLLPFRLLEVRASQKPAPRAAGLHHAHVNMHQLHINWEIR